MANKITLKCCYWNVFGCFIDGSRFFKEPAEIVCHDFEAFSRGCILSEL